MVKLLQSQVRRVKTYLFKGDVLEAEYAVTGVALDLIAPHVSQRKNLKGFEALAKDIQANTMINPIIVIPNTQKNYDLASRNVVEEFLCEYNPDKNVLAYSGNQRLEVARQLDIEVIDCILCENVEWAHAISLKLNEGKLENETTLVNTQRQ